MWKLGIVALLTVCVAGNAHAQCCGDCNGDGEVSISDLITAVNNALGGCGQPTPTLAQTPTPTRKPTPTATPADRCPFGFDDPGTNLCVFNGTFNRGCGNALDSVFSTSGSMLIINIDTMLASPPRVSFAATVTSPTSANLTAWSSNDFRTTHPTSGTAQLTNNGNQLVIFPNDPPFMILSCNFVQYTGTFVVAPGAGLRRDAAAPDAAAFERLHQWLVREPPELSGGQDAGIRTDD